MAWFCTEEEDWAIGLAVALTPPTLFAKAGVGVTQIAISAERYLRYRLRFASRLFGRSELYLQAQGLSSALRTGNSHQG